MISNGVAVVLTAALLVCATAARSELSPTANDGNSGKSFHSAIDVRAGNESSTAAAGSSALCRQTIDIPGGPYRIDVDTCETPDLTEWTKTTLAPVIRDWYPKLAELLPSEGFKPPEDILVRFSASLKGVAETSGTRIRCAAEWFRTNLKGEAAGSVVHELVHVVQQYGKARRANPDSIPSPGWLVEGIADYIRWFLYEPQSHGADIPWMRERKNLRLRYDAGYRITANFLDWVTTKYDKSIVQRLNAAMRQGKYREDIWKEHTGQSLPELGDEWKREVERQLAQPGNHENGL